MDGGGKLVKYIISIPHYYHYLVLLSGGWLSSPVNSTHRDKFSPCRRDLSGRQSRPGQAHVPPWLPGSNFISFHFKLQFEAPAFTAAILHIESDLDKY